MKKETNITGFSAIELLIGLVVIAIGLAVSIPAMQNFTNTNRQADLINKLVGDLNYAKSEAVKRGTTVTISQLKDADGNVTGTNGNWFSGWEIKSGATVLKTVPAITLPTYTLVETGNIISISFSSGGTISANRTFNMCGPDIGNDTDKQITISVTGRVTLNGKYDCTPPPS